MSISERIENTIENWQAKWKDRLRGWMASWVMNGVERLMDFLEPDLRAETKASMERLKTIEGLPDDFRAILDKATEEPKAVQLTAILPYLVGIMIGLGMGAAAPMSRIGSYQIDKLVHSARLSPDLAIRALWRGLITREHLISSLKDQGWSDNDIKTLEDVAWYVPSAAEQVTWLAREVYEPDMIEKYGLDDEMPVYENTDFKKIGVSPEQMRNYWRAHWEHASWTQVIEMLHRGQLTEDDVWEWFRLVEIPPFWRQKLINVSWNVPTRVDVRRWWDMRTIDEARLREVYQWLGYHGKDLDDYVLWTKVYVAFPDLMARFKNGWITEDDVRGQLIALGMPPERVEEMIQTKVKPDKPERVTNERDLTKTEIYKGVKKGLISWQEGVELLLDLGYDEYEANYILAINVGALEGSPETYPEFKHITQLYRKSQGLRAMEVPQEIIDASKELAKARAELKEAEAKGLEGAPLAPYLKAVSDAEYRYRQLLVKWEEEKKKLS